MHREYFSFRSHYSPFFLSEHPNHTAGQAMCLPRYVPPALFVIARMSSTCSAWAPPGTPCRMRGGRLRWILAREARRTRHTQRRRARPLKGQLFVLCA